MAWTSHSDLKKQLLKNWKKGHILRSLITGEPVFPIKIKLKAPTREQLTTDYFEVLKWIKELKRYQKKEGTYGYALIEREVNYQNLGKNTIPTHVEVASLEDLKAIIPIEGDHYLFVRNSQQLLSYSPLFEQWIIKNPFKLIDKLGIDIDKYIKVLTWFEANDYKHLYIRQFDIAGVDTKFIETNKPLLTELLDVVLPITDINMDSRKFEERYGIKTKPSHIRFRLLDNQIANCFTELTASVEEFEIWNPEIKYFFLVENEINFLTFPTLKDSCVIFAKGYNVELLKNVKWLQAKETYYWGDIDTHGFNILSRVRSFLPNIKSFLMSEEILLAHKKLWVVEDKQFAGNIQLLADEEEKVVEKLQSASYGFNVRLEQERIEYKYIEAFVTKFTFNMNSGATTNN